MDDIPLTIILHYAGQWECKPHMKYVGGTVRIFDNIPADVNGNYMRRVIESLDYEDIVKIH